MWHVLATKQLHWPCWSADGGPVANYACPNLGALSQLLVTGDSMHEWRGTLLQAAPQRCTATVLAQQYSCESQAAGSLLLLA